MANLTDTELDALIHKGLAAQQQNHLSEAQECYSQVLQSSPEHFNANQLLGTVYLQGGDSMQALSFINKALSIKQTIAGQLPMSK